MNLGKLLGVGRSMFSGGTKAEYRVNKHVRLPKFNDGQNPFAPQESAEAAPEAAVPAPPAPVKPEVQSNRLSPAAPQPEKAEVRPAAHAAVKPARQGWTTRLNPFRAPEAAVTRQPMAVQAELSLDSVKVVHNDLADADVEIVPVKSHSAVPAAPVLPPARHAWEYLGENLLKAR